MTIQENMVIGELVALDYRAASVFKKFGIDFCCQGNRTLQDACETKNIRTVQVIDSLREALKVKNENGTLDFGSWPINVLADYIEETHHDYVKTKIEEIIPYLVKVCRVHGERHPELIDIYQEFMSSAEELRSHMQKEEVVLFPYVRKMMGSSCSITSSRIPQFGSIENPIKMMKEEHLIEGNRFSKIEALSSNYTVPEDACMTFRVTYALLKEFQDDLHQHIHLENNILFPKVLETEKSLNIYQ